MDAETLKKACSMRIRGATYAAIAKALGVPQKEVTAELKVLFAAIEHALENGQSGELPWCVDENKKTGAQQ